MKVTYIERSPGVWRLRIETGVSADGRRLFKYETVRGTLDDVQRRRFELLQQHDEGSFAESSKVTFKQFFDHWIATRRALGKITRSTSENYEKIYNYFLQPLGGRRLQSIVAQEVQSIYTEIAPRVSRGTLIHTHKILRAYFAAARKAKLVKVNIMEEVEAPDRPRIKPRAMTQDRAGELLQSLEGHWMQNIVALALVTGLRRGEVLGLRWGDIDLAGAKLHVAGQLVQYENQEVEWCGTKTDAGLRRISLGVDAVELLSAMRRAAAELRLRLGLGGKLDDVYVFVRDDGVSPVKPATLGSMIRRHCDERGFGDFSFHVARHTHLTHLLAQVGKSGAKAVSQRAGHANVMTTLSVYQTVFEEDDRALADMSGGLLKKKGP